MANRRFDVHKVADPIVFEAVRKFLGNPEDVQAIADYLNLMFPDEIAQSTGRKQISREQIYPLVREGIRRKFLFFAPPYEWLLSGELQHRFRLTQEIRVVNARQALEEATAQLLFELITVKLASLSPIRIGLGSGPLIMNLLNS